MADPTWCTIPSDKIRMFMTKEAVKGDFLEAGGTFYHPLSFSHTDGHTPVIRPPHTGSRHRIAKDSLIKGQFDPAIQVVMPLRYDDTELQLETILGGASVGGAWSVANILPGISIGFSDTVRYWEHAGSHGARVTIDSAFGTMVTGAFDYRALSRASNPDTGGTAFPAGVPADTVLRPYLMEDLEILTDPSATPVTETKPQGITITIDNQVFTNRAPGSIFPNCITPGGLLVNGTMRFEYSVEWEAQFRSVVEDYDLFYIRVTWTTGTKFVRMLMPVKLTVPTYSAAEGQAPMTADVNFEAAADTFALTTETIVATSTTFV